MLRNFRGTFTLAALVSCGLASADPDVRLPPGTRTDKDGQVVSGRGLRESTEWVSKELARTGIAVTQVGPYRVRGVEVTRFISATASTTWLALHIVRLAGKTLITFVPRPKS